MNINLKIIITKEYKLLIQIESKYEEEIYPCISFNGNFIEIGKENKTSINFIKEWIENPEEYRLYSVLFQGKEYSVLAEVLFGLIINEYKQKIERENIIENTIIEIPTENKLSIQRIKISLNALGLRGMEIAEDEEIEYDYTEQGEYLEEIKEKKEILEKQNRIIERAKKINPTMKDKLNQIDLNDETMVEDNKFENELSKIFTTKERTAMKMCQLDNYCIFIASRYFNSLQDHQNLTYVSKKYKYNMEKFHYNPISLTTETISLYPNIETLHIYEERDKYLEGGRIERYVNWNRIEYHKFKEMKDNKEGKEIEYKRIVWTKDDTEKEYGEQYLTNEWGIDFRIQVTLPKGIKEIDGNCFDYFYDSLEELTIPTTVKIIPKKCLERCWNLTNISLPLNESQIILGNKIFKNQSHLEQDIYLPDSIQIINGKEVNQTISLEIPTTITSLDEDCFYGCYELKQLTIPDTVIDIPFNTLMKLHYSEEITIETNKCELKGDRFFYVKENSLHSIHFSSIKKINNQEVKPLKTYTIPSNVTKLSDYCFANCEELTEIKGLEHIKEYGKGCFVNCSRLNREQYPEVEKNVEEYVNENVKEEHQKQLEEWTSMQCSKILFDSKIDCWSYETSVMNERIIGKKQLTFLIEDEDGEIFGFYLNTKIVEKYCPQKQETDSKTFQFNLQSQNNRLNQPMKFEIKDLEYGGILLYENSDYDLIELGDINLCKENIFKSSCKQNENKFDYHGIENALCGKEPDWNGDNFTPKRILVIQMK